MDHEANSKIVHMLYDFLTGHVSPFASLGFDIRKPRPSEQQLRQNARNFVSAFWKHCRDIDEFEDCRRLVESKLEHALQELRGERTTFGDVDRLQQGVRQSVVNTLKFSRPWLIGVYGVLLVKFAELAAAWFVRPQSDWYSIGVTAMFAALSVLPLFWLLTWRRGLAWLGALSATAPVACYYFLARADLLRGITSEATQFGIHALLPLAGYLGTILGIVLVRDLEATVLRQTTRFLASSGLPPNILALPAATEESSGLRRFFERTGDKSRSRGTLLGLLLSCVTLVFSGLLVRAANQRTPLLPPSASELRAVEEAKSLRNSLSSLEVEKARLNRDLERAKTESRPNQEGELQERIRKLERTIQELRNDLERTSTTSFVPGTLFFTGSDPHEPGGLMFIEAGGRWEQTTPSRSGDYFPDAGQIVMRDDTRGVVYRLKANEYYPASRSRPFMTVSAESQEQVVEGEESPKTVFTTWKPGRSTAVPSGTYSIDQTVNGIGLTLEVSGSSFRIETGHASEKIIGSVTSYKRCSLLTSNGARQYAVWDTNRKLVFLYHCSALADRSPCLTLRPTGRKPTKLQSSSQTPDSSVGLAKALLRSEWRTKDSRIRVQFQPNGEFFIMGFTVASAASATGTWTSKENGEVELQLRKGGKTLTMSVVNIAGRPTIMSGDEQETLFPIRPGNEIER